MAVICKPSPTRRRMIAISLSCRQLFGDRSLPTRWPMQLPWNWKWPLKLLALGSWMRKTIGCEPLIALKILKDGASTICIYSIQPKIKTKKWSLLKVRSPAYTFVHLCPVQFHYLYVAGTKWWRGVTGRDEAAKRDKKEQRHRVGGDSGVNMPLWSSQEAGELTLVIV